VSTVYITILNTFNSYGPLYNKSPDGVGLLLLLTSSKL